MKILYYYVDFLLKSFDIEGRISRKGFWITLTSNTVLMVLLVSVGLAVPKGRPLEVYIAASSIVSTPLIPPYITMILRRLNDTRKSRLYALLMLLPMGIGMVPLLFLCAGKSAYGTTEDFSAYRPTEKVTNIASSALKNMMTVFPFVYLIYMICKLLLRSGIPGANLALLSINLVICVLTVIGLFKPKIQEAIPFINTLKKLTTLSNAMLTIILYQDTQSFVEAVLIVYLYFYVMVSPAIITADIIKFVKNRKLSR